MGLKQGPPVQAKVTVSKKGIAGPNELTFGQEFLIPAGYEPVDVTSFKTIAFDYNKSHPYLKLSNDVTLMEVGTGGAPPNLGGKCFYLHNAQFEWRLIKHGNSTILVPLKKPGLEF